MKTTVWVLIKYKKELTIMVLYFLLQKKNNKLFKKRLIDQLLN